MFTGLVKEVGRVANIVKIAGGYRLKIESARVSKSLDVGGSLAVNGVCLTLVEASRNILSFDVMEETIRRTNLPSLKNGDLVNLENSLKAGDAFGGHFVLGHIDCLGKVRDVVKKGDSVSMEIEIPKEFMHLIVEKGSIAIDGISLTIGTVKGNIFNIHLIPHTLKVTTLLSKRRGDELNLEFDIIGKYIARFKEIGTRPGLTEEFLKEKGFS